MKFSNQLWSHRGVAPLCMRHWFRRPAQSALLGLPQRSLPEQQLIQRGYWRWHSFFHLIWWWLYYQRLLPAHKRNTVMSSTAQWRTMKRECKLHCGNCSKRRCALSHLLPGGIVTSAVVFRTRTKAMSWSRSSLSSGAVVRGEGYMTSIDQRGPHELSVLAAEDGQDTISLMSL